MSTLIEQIKTGKKDLTGAYLSGADLGGVDLSGACLLGAYLIGANLRTANLSGADLRGANLNGANLIGADLSGVDLRGANLIGADLSSVNLGGANLIGADLSSVNLGGANLVGADLSGVDLSGANLIGADLYGVKGLSSSWEEMRILNLLLAEIESNIDLFDMKNWHSNGRVSGSSFGEVINRCGTTHCGAGFCQVLLAKEGNRASLMDTPCVGSYAIPSMARLFFATEEEFLSYLRLLISGKEPLLKR